MKHRLALFLALLFFVLLASSCEPSAPPPVYMTADQATQTALPHPTALPAPVSSQGQAGTLRLVVSTFGGFDPLAASDPGTEQVQALVYETLFAYDAAGRLVPMLAAEVPSVGEDGLTWTIMLRAGIVFHDGMPLDGATVAAALNDALSRVTGERPFPLAVEALRRVVESISGDDLTVTLHLREPYPLLPELLAEQSLAITYGEGVGTGPFQIDPVSGDLTFTPNPNYHGGVPLLSAVQVQITADSSESMAAVTAGAADLTAVGDVGLPEDTQSYAAQSGMTRQAWLIFNRSFAPLENAAVRLAVNSALDRTALVGTVGVSASPDGRFAFDPLHARQMLADGGWPDGFDMVILQSVPSPLAESLRDQLSSIHVGVAPIETSEAELLQAIHNGEPVGALLVSWAPDWAGQEWFALAGWGSNALAALESDPPGASLYTAQVIYLRTPGLDSLGMTSGGWPRVTAQTRLP